MATVGETKALIAHVNALIANAMVATQSAAGLYTEARVALDGLKSSTMAPLGGPALDRAIEQCEEAFVRGHVAIEQNEIYGGTL